MPLKLNVGLAKKVGQPGYGSLCSSCHIECELDAMLLATDLEQFQARVRQAFAACSRAVHDELARQQAEGGNAPTSQGRPTARVTDSEGVHPARNGNGQRVTAKQLDYARKLAGDVRGLTAGRLDVLATRMFGKPLAELTSLDASNLIDTLKQIKAGHIDTDAALAGGST